MLFNSFDFLLFFLVVFVAFYSLKPSIRWVILLVASYFFYMYWNPAYIFLIIISTCIDYFIGKTIPKLRLKKQKLQLLLLSLTCNLGLLFFFKYYNFLIDTVNDLVSLFNTDINYEHHELLLPVGISFYTFQTLSYTIDIYKGKIKPEKHFGKFALYVAFFPQLVAGPIERARNLLPQLNKNDQSISYTNFKTGFSQVIIGFFKKVVIADTAALYVDNIYGSYEIHQGFTLVFATVMFAFQIYCDFSGYSDIAIGTAKMLGYNFLENFHLPYFSKSVTEFWRRWHISLSSWLKDYLYIPLGGNRRGALNVYRNLMITMLLGGLWHGASWNFVIWGFLNGLFLSIEKIVVRRKPANTGKNAFIKLIGVIYTFTLICFTWIFFRSETFDQAITISKNIFVIDNFMNLAIRDSSVFASMVLNIGILIIMEYLLFRKQALGTFFKELSIIKFIVLNAFLLLLIILFGISDGSQFIYFQF